MTEDEWLDCQYSYDMLEHIESIATPRKLRLFACGCCRRMWHRLPEESRNVVLIAERQLDCQATHEELRSAIHAAPRGKKKSGAHWNSVQLKPFAQAQRTVLTLENHIAFETAWNAARESMTLLNSGQCDILRDIFGNPFQPIEFIGEHVPQIARRIAREIYDQLQFDRLPELAEALETGGVDNNMVLDHCRHCRDHVRGCWVVDQLLGYA